MNRFTIVYGKILNRKTLRKIPPQVLACISNAIEAKLSTHPHYFGKSLSGSLKGCRRLRVEDYRVIYRIVRETVEIYAIEHRSVVYEYLERKLRGRR